MYEIEFEDYNLGSVVGQSWAGGTVTGSGKWTSSKWGTAPQPDPEIIVGPVFGEKCLKIATVVPAGTSSYNAPMFAQYAVFNPAEYIYHYILNTANTAINLNMIVYLPDVKSKIQISSEYPIVGGHRPILRCQMPGTSAATGKMYPNGETYQQYASMRTGAWYAVNLTMDLTFNNDAQTAMVSAHIDSTDVAAQTMNAHQVDNITWPYLYIGIHGSSYTGAENYMLVDRIYLTGVSGGPAGKIPPRRGALPRVSGVTGDNLTTLPSMGWGY